MSSYNLYQKPYNDSEWNDMKSYTYDSSESYTSDSSESCMSNSSIEEHNNRQHDFKTHSSHSNVLKGQNVVPGNYPIMMPEQFNYQRMYVPMIQGQIPYPQPNFTQMFQQQTPPQPNGPKMFQQQTLPIYYPQPNGPQIFQQQTQPIYYPQPNSPQMSAKNSMTQPMIKQTRPILPPANGPQILPETLLGQPMFQQQTGSMHLQKTIPKQNGQSMSVPPVATICPNQQAVCTGIAYAEDYNKSQFV